MSKIKRIEGHRFGRPIHSTEEKKAHKLEARRRCIQRLRAKLQREIERGDPSAQGLALNGILARRGSVKIPSKEPGIDFNGLSKVIMSTLLEDTQKR